jgi:hypothetical protein
MQDRRQQYRTALLLLQDCLATYDSGHECAAPAGGRHPVDLLRAEVRWLQEQLARPE